MIRIGVICPSEIAARRFMPALKKCKEFVFVGIGVATKEERFKENNLDPEVMKSILLDEKNKAKNIVDAYGGHIFDGYNSIVNSDEIDAIYIPLPPGLHYIWAKKALENGKHVLVEKPSTTNYLDSQDLVEIAKKHNVAIHENYMFAFHKQLDEIKTLIDEGSIGDTRLVRIDFGFPMRSQNDFRFKKELGGGALLDCGGYTLKLAAMILGDTARITTSHLNYIDGFDVDFFGSATLVNEKGTTVQVSFGMDNDYRCNLDVWGSKGTLFTGRVLTAPNDFEPTALIKNGTLSKEVKLSRDDTFLSSINYFLDCIQNSKTREESYKAILQQAKLVYNFLSNIDKKGEN